MICCQRNLERCAGNCGYLSLGIGDSPGERGVLQLSFLHCGKGSSCSFLFLKWTSRINFSCVSSSIRFLMPAIVVLGAGNSVIKKFAAAAHLDVYKLTDSELPEFHVSPRSWLRSSVLLLTHILNWVQQLHAAKGEGSMLPWSSQPSGADRNPTKHQKCCDGSVPRQCRHRERVALSTSRSFPTLTASFIWS